MTKKQVEHEEYLKQSLWDGLVWTNGNSRTSVQDLNACQACNGRGRRAGKIKTCPGCEGSGQRTERKQMGSMIQRFQVLCSDYNGEGELPKAGSRCTLRNGTDKQPPPRVPRPIQW